jgi:hypothetical protein
MTQGLNVVPGTRCRRNRLPQPSCNSLNYLYLMKSGSIGESIEQEIVLGPWYEK